jgi:hypothetical protein
MPRYQHSSCRHILSVLSPIWYRLVS